MKKFLKNIIKAPYLIECSCCHKMKSDLIIKNKRLICLDCYNKDFKNLFNKPKLTKIQIASIRKNIKDYEKNRPKTKIIFGGCFN